MPVRQLAQVSVGDVVGPVTVPVARETLVAYANASLDQNPIHQDEAFARSVGLPDVIAHGMWTMGASGTETGRVTVDVTTTCGGYKVLGRCIAVVRLD